MLVEETQAHTFHSLVIRGKICMAVRWITERDKGGVLHMREAREPVLNVFWAKQPEARAFYVQIPNTYSVRPTEMVSLDLTYDTII